MLVVLASTGFAAVLAVAVQSVVDDATPPVISERTRHLDLDVQAALISASAADAQAALQAADAGDDAAGEASARAELSALQRECESLPSEHLGVAESAVWIRHEGRWVCEVRHAGS